MADDGYQQQQNQQGGSPLIGSYQSTGLNPNTVALELSNTDIIDDFIHALKGERFNENSERWESIGGELVNAKGRSKLLTVMLSVTNRNIILSNLEDEDIDAMSNEIGQSLITWLENNYEEWGIDESGIETVYSLLITNIYAALRRAREGETRDQIAQSLHRIEGREPARRQESGLMDRLNPFR